MGKVIILSRMYVGSYLQENIGHEVINLFKTDNNENYIYVSDDGRINPKYNDSVEAVLLVRYVEKGVMEVLAKAEKLEQILYKSNISEESKNQVNYVNDNDIKYGGVSPQRVLGNTEAEKIVITFKTNKLRKVKKTTYLIEDSDKMEEYENAFYLPEKHFSSQSLKMYYPKEEYTQDYDVLQSIISDENIWENVNTTEKLNLIDIDTWRQRNSFLSIIKKEYDELVFSNMLAYFFDQNRSVFIDFTKNVLKIPSFSSDFRIVRESNDNIDLWIEDDNSIIIIENKIKSKINGERHDIYSEKVQSQLNKYYSYAKEQYPNKIVYCYIFTPNYNPINLQKYKAGEYYKIINYSYIYEFYMKYAGKMIHTSYFSEFLDAIHIHASTIDNSNYEIMKNRFIQKIKKVLENEIT